MSAGRERFTKLQLDAVDVSKRHLDACVVAGPGSGKTTVLVEYFQSLVDVGVDPLRILAITFTEKAASNMRQKLADRFRDQHEMRGRLERAWVSTVHGFCTRLLKENAVFAGVDPEFQVADERESWRLQQESIAAAMDAVFQEHPLAMRALIRGLSSYQFEGAVLSAYDAMRGAGVRVGDLAGFAPPPGVTLADVAATLAQLRGTPVSAWNPVQKQHLWDVMESAERVATARDALEALRGATEFTCNLQKCKRGTEAYELVQSLRKQIEESKYSLITEHFTGQRKLLMEILERFDRMYRERKRQAGALDFADLEEFAVRLLEEHAETRARLQAQFDHILMDEFQDTNGQQAKLLKLVRQPDRFYAVGDINQSIFGFRHAEPEGFREYRDAVARGGRHLVELVDNFRSRPEILSAVETVAAGLAGIEARSLVAGRRFDRAKEVAVEVMSILGEELVEAKWVARRILELLEAEPQFAFRDVAVLVRNTEVLTDIGAAFEEAGIPYLVNRGRGFYETREVNDLTHLLRVMANPQDEISLAVVLRSPLVEASDEALLRLRVMSTQMVAALYGLGPEHEPAFGSDDFGKLCRFRDRLREWRLRREFVSFDRLLLAAMDDCGYRATPNIDKFLAQARDAAARMTLDEFVEELAMVREENPREPDAPPEDSANAVKVMTVHSAKGLEFPIVFVAALHKGVKTDPPAVAFSREFGLGARWRNPAKREDKDDLFQHALRAERKEREEQESHRLLYVAMTRAEEHLVLSFSGDGKKPANWAGYVTRNLELDLETLGERTETRTAPDGKEWKLRVLVADGAPEVLPRAAATETAREVAFLPPAAVTEQQDTNAPVTALAHFLDCPRQYYLGQYLGFEGRTRRAENAEEDGDLAAGEFGTQVHAMLAGAEVPDPDPEAARLAEVFRSSPLGRRAARATRVEREFDFLLAVDGLVLTGQVDLWFEEGGELALVDYKTDAVNPAEAHLRARDYAMQLRLYALAVERVAGRAVNRAWLHFLKPNTLVPVDVAPSLLDSPEQVVREFVEAQNALEFRLHEGEHCKRCEFFRGLCPAGGAHGRL